MSTPDFHALFSRLSSNSTPVTSPFPPSPQHLDPTATVSDLNTTITGSPSPLQAPRLRLVNRSQLAISQSSQSGISEPRVVERNVEGELQQDPISTQAGGKSPMTAPQQREDSPLPLSSGQQSRGSNPVGAPQAE